MFLFDNRITLENRDLLEEYLNGFEYKTSGLSYSALYMWRDINQFSWDMIGDYMCMSGVSHLELEQGIELPFMFPPLTKTGGYDRESLRRTIYEARDFFEGKGHQEIARLLGIGKDSSASQLLRAKSLLAKMIRKYNDNKSPR